MKYCSACGKQLADDARFCEGCGVGAVPPVAPTPASRRKVPYVLVIGVVVVLVLGAAGAAYALRPKPMDPDDYADEVERIVSEMVDANEEWFDGMERVFDSLDSEDYDNVGEDTVAEIEDLTSDTHSTIVGLREELEEMMPPEEYEDAHDQLLDATEYVPEFWAGVINECKLNSGGLGVSDVQETADSYWSDEESRASRTAEDIREACDEIGVDPFGGAEQLEPLFSDDY